MQNLTDWVTMCADVCNSLSFVNTQCMQSAHMAKTAAISVRVEPTLKDALEAAAKKDDRTLAQYVERVLTAHLRAEGMLKAQSEK
jgi:predicted HicB family RNase H-like nuclease